VRRPRRSLGQGDNGARHHQGPLGSCGGTISISTILIGLHFPCLLLWGECRGVYHVVDSEDHADHLRWRKTEVSMGKMMKGLPKTYLGCQ
jgi:hypothetical protein